ncbi:hypothetical protein PPYR_09521 [Photinus pyralis]|uniref:Protein krueppel n=2 Tax=Photinus pyralis TaxID=7054 RepID=A0A1Y1N9K8_PHOPY|nr:zinc finger protein 2-like [Photinus pyralis]XP_031345620.1 zinc finger protein 2-like [Photinus pyralis]KAB0798528.1 hypothetical protein PPYR_09521 [Photinus pyralis]
MEDTLKVKNDYPYVCRVCLTEEGEFQSVFVADENSGVKIHLAEMIMAYTSLQITLGDGLPEHICIACANKVVHLYLFKQQCEESDAVLREQLCKAERNTYAISEEHRLTAEVLHIDPDVLDVVIKPEASANDELLAKVDISTARLENYTVALDKNDNGSDVEEIGEKAVHISCDVCFKSFTRVSYLNRHKKVHSNVKEFVCNECSKSFSRNDLLVRHQVTHNVKVENYNLPFISEDGGQEQFGEDLEFKWQFVKNEENLSSQNHKSTSLQCNICNKKFTKTSHYTRHLKIHAKVKAYSCQLCNKGFARSEQLVNHMNAHSGVKPHVCSICNKGFNQVSNLKDHMRTHNGEKPFLCSICGKGFNQLGNLRQHTVRHSGVKAHLCSTCGSGFASKGELCAHLRKHTGARPFVCPICNHGFTTSSSLTKHKRIHSGEKPYECDVCKMKFSRSGILARHKRTHTGEKPYVCKYCTKAFSQSNDLSSHLRIHTGEKPYVCDTCGNCFRQSSALKTHKKTHIDKTQSLEIDKYCTYTENAFITIPQ